MKNEPTNNEPGLQRDPDEWKTGDEASKRIDELRERSPRLSQD